MSAAAVVAYHDTHFQLMIYSRRSNLEKLLDDILEECVEQLNVGDGHEPLRRNMSN